MGGGGVPSDGGEGTSVGARAVISHGEDNEVAAKESLYKIQEPRCVVNPTPQKMGTLYASEGGENSEKVNVKMRAFRTSLLLSF